MSHKINPQNMESIVFNPIYASADHDLTYSKNDKSHAYDTLICPSAKPLARWSIPDFRIVMRDQVPAIVEILSLNQPSSSMTTGFSNHMSLQNSAPDLSHMDHLQTVINAVLFAGVEQGTVCDPLLGDMLVTFKQFQWIHQSRYLFTNRLTGKVSTPTSKIQFLIQYQTSISVPPFVCGTACNIPVSQHTLNTSLECSQHIHGDALNRIGNVEIVDDTVGLGHDEPDSLVNPTPSRGQHSICDSVSSRQAQFQEISSRTTRSKIPHTAELLANKLTIKHTNPHVRVSKSKSHFRVARRVKIVLSDTEKQVFVKSIVATLAKTQQADSKEHTRILRSITFRKFVDAK
ncbi:hypothetical protein BATDEDRAFT_21286 [Batrachochytrium dendrobatidis JAM81]|uniref:Uncharacterized protein n=1 Tax=Batrachochytrium dendrobatidis (strain JAM81 / FGSC 10211) TaxID=684364 RepID=F4NS74_BATDJ|nr:uncharacterized protein BATDEDRAFT_21286 [Batrachochytrium dendrobatidis JAM81]EGF82996.1 hypothetical protein BATDEDRAFT_21286 [Batrachochytrium dendrobatidis JAM81]KAJ8331599.1 hypothetical protein O5D80_000510 [Batrachochytrium dendrobatidis]|eukprot:XP_006675244.1 hypothetical protein BATDEDRAFT_21286 [Batrachochytrium dendrobatidis JAM81]